jgi:hypothetical protein
LVADAVRTGAEHAAAFDADTALPVGPLRVGNAAEVDVTDQLSMMRRDGRYVMLHTHRASTAFSDRDVEVLLENPAVRVIGALGHDGTWHLLSKRIDGAVASRAAGATAFAAAMRQLAPHYLAVVRSGRMAREAALRHLLHEVWRVIAPPLGLRYDRVR